jgi:hypothetical protein
MQEPLTIYCLPISGVSFPSQLGILAALSNGRRYAGQADKRNVPDIALASSGGNLASYYAHSAGWNRERLYSGVGMFEQESFLTGWADYVPSWLFLPFSHSIFRRGYGFASFFHRIFAPGQAREGTEIWTGTVSHSARQHCVFTNKAKGHTILEPRISKPGVLPNFGDNLEPIYLDGDLRALADATQASASIPWVVKPTPFRGDKYSDGGGIFCSPLPLFEANIKQLGKNGNKKLRLFYISPYNVDKSPRVLFEILKEITDLLRGSAAYDMRTFVNIISALGGNDLNPDHYDNLASPQRVAEMLTDLENNFTHFAVLLYPENDQPEIELSTSFHYLEIHKAMLAAEKSLKAYVWKVT